MPGSTTYTWQQYPWAKSFTNPTVTPFPPSQPALISPNLPPPPLAVGPITTTGPVLGASGSSSAPTYSFITNPSTGIYLPLSNTLCFVTGGVDAWRVAGNSSFFPATNNVSDVGSTALSVRNLYVAGAVKTGVKAGAAVDADVTNPTDGMLRVDSTNGRIYVRYGGAWHYAALT